VANEPMELAKNYDPKHADKFLPGYMQVKYDGVPLTYERQSDGTVIALTRQREQVKSVPHLIEQITPLLSLRAGSSVTAECFVPGQPFKVSSGIIRRQTPDEDTQKITGVIFDANIEGHSKETYYIRYTQVLRALPIIMVSHEIHKPDIGFGFTLAPSTLVNTIEELEAHYKVMLKEYGAGLEGAMIHKLNKPFNPGKRCWGMCRYKPQPTIDLEVDSYEEAVSEEGDPLGMVGRVNVRLRRQDRPDSVIGVGPGKLTHAERETLWRSCVVVDGHGRATPPARIFAEIKYMPDPTYDALRQPTVQRLRTDKTEGDILEY
jgi:ATP-dependent DNA ligase